MLIEGSAEDTKLSYLSHGRFGVTGQLGGFFLWHDPTSPEDEHGAELYELKLAKYTEKDIFSSSYFYSQWCAPEERELCISAITNLIKTRRFLQLLLQEAQDQISEEEMENELTTNCEHYVVRTKISVSPFSMPLIRKIVEDTGEDLSVSEVSEMFGVDLGATGQMMLF